MKTTGYNILVSAEDFEVLREEELISRQTEDGHRREDSCASLNRAVSWFSKYPCAVLTAWRNGKTRQENDSNNHDLQLALRGYGYGLCRVKGCYAEVGKPTSRENSFLVFNLVGSTMDFFNRIFALSTKYEQDSFLFKDAGNDKPAYLFKTNDTPDPFFGNMKRKAVGVLHIDSKSAENYSRVGSGKISFEEKPLNESLERKQADSGI